jgi:hypothetical protein
MVNENYSQNEIFWGLGGIFPTAFDINHPKVM